MFWLLPVTAPPRVKALMVSGPALYLEMLLVSKPVVAVTVVARIPLARSRLPEKELLPVPEEKN